MGELSCTDCAELSAEVALGVAEAEERAAVLVHVERCPACRSELRSMGEVADALLELVPPMAPTSGIEARVVASLADGPNGNGAAVGRLWWSDRRARRLVAAAAVVAALAVGVGGWFLGQGSSTPTSGVATAQLLAGRSPVGEVMIVTTGERPWISMAVHLKVGPTLVKCEIQGAHGASRTLGTFEIVGGYGYWASPLPWRHGVRSAELVTPSGRVLASASVGAL